jgi:hypothetical protein
MVVKGFDEELYLYGANPSTIPNFNRLFKWIRTRHTELMTILL